jgi:hypothetical protein
MVLGLGIPYALGLRMNHAEDAETNGEDAEKTLLFSASSSFSLRVLCVISFRSCTRKSGYVV